MKTVFAIAIAAAAMAGAALAQPQMTPEMQAAREAMTKACAADMKTLCDGKTGREANMCLRENQAKASAGCKDALSKMPMMRGGGGGGGGGGGAAPAAPGPR